MCNSSCRVNDVHSKLNATQVADVVQVRTVDDVTAAIARAAREGLAVSIAGGRHAMGGQQFGAGTLLLDMGGLNRVLSFDAGQGRVEVEAGIQWPALMLDLHVRQRGRARQWGIRQKQTGADRLSIGGAIAANIHGRGLDLAPFSQDLISLELVDAWGRLRRCSREENAELFRRVVGGYGLFGVVVRATLQLAPRQQVERVVELTDLEALLPMIDQRMADGHLYGDFQFSTDPASDNFLSRGIFSCYRPLEDERPIPADQLRLSRQDWGELLYLAHADKAAAYDKFSRFYLASSGQRYWSDTHQLSIYLDDYHQALDQALGATCPGSEMITELYVPPERLGAFMADCREDFRRHGVDLIYGTVRMIRQDQDSFLPWAARDWACVIFNLHADHSPAGLARVADDFRRLIDIAIRHQGSYFLTYHRHARRDQVLACYPRFPEFLREKLRHDPEERFQSDWYRHYRAMFADLLHDDRAA